MNRPQDVSLATSVKAATLGLTLIGGWLVLFTIGSQLPSATYEETLGDAGRSTVARAHAVVMLLMTKPVPSICLLSVFASSLGMWRRRNTLGRDAKALEAYISASISGLVCGILVQAFPSLFSTILDFSKDQNTYSVFALVSSFIGFLSGYDRTFFDGVVNRGEAILESRFGSGRDDRRAPAAPDTPAREPEPTAAGR